MQLRDDLKTGELSLAVFAADLFDVVMQKGRRRVYEDPAEFFALTHPTYNLRELVRDVIHRLSGQSDKAYRKLAVNYGGGKTHTLIALRHLVNEPDGLPDLPAVHEFKAHIGAGIPKARVAALCFDKIDLEKGVETPAPDGSIRMLRHPWSVLAFQLVGAEGLRLIHAEGRDTERETPPAEPLMVELLARPQAEGLSTLVLLDEVLMYIRTRVEADPTARGSLVSFFQYLTQAVVKVDRCAMVASLLASDPRKHDDFGNELLRDVSEVFGRQMEEDASPVSKEDVAEVLRRRFFKPESIRDPGVFRPHVTSVVGNIAAIDERTHKERAAEEDRYLGSYPFHPDLTEVFYTRWTQLDGFQRTRGILRTFAIALRDAEGWDASPLIGPNVLLKDPEQNGLEEAAGELANYASVDTETGRHQEWRPILEGELAKAREIQAETTGLRHREMEQAVIVVFLSSQPIGQKALTRELFVWIGGASPDRIELAKALYRWTELSWFLDESEVATAAANRDGTRELPRAWRLGNRPNLRQMHPAACNNRVPPAQVESQIVEHIAKLKALTAGASAAGAKVHNLPEKPADVADDGDFHYAVLDPEAASESGKPSAEARRFLDETTAANRPRVYRNATVLAVPSRDGLDATRARVREYLGWEEVRSQLKDQSIDPVREQMLSTETAAAKRRIPEAIRQAYSIVVTVGEENVVQAFKIVVTDEPLFTIIKADPRARIQETAISSEALLPGGPYDLWREGEHVRRIKDLVGAFAQFPKLPKMLRSREILETVLQGVLDGIWVARVTRPDKTCKTFWRTTVDEPVLRDPGLEVLLPEHAALTEIAPELLKKGSLPGLWKDSEISVQDVYGYFAGGHTVSVPRDGYEDTLDIPKCEPSDVEIAVTQAIEQGTLWLTAGPASILCESVPAGVLGSSATLRPPPERIPVNEMMAESIPGAWKDGKTNALAIATTLSHKTGMNLPWFTIRTAIDEGMRARWIEVSDEGAPWPCDISGAQHVTLQVPDRTDVREDQDGQYRPKPAGQLTAEAELEASGIQDLSEVLPDILNAAVGSGIRFNFRIELGGETPPDPETVEKLNKILSEVSDKLKLE
ncbi:MAG: ATP-binding protein [Gemmatimonadetes bacterium]|nr:ATP-binding protein [Gemmatimonadota bacterium]